MKASELIAELQKKMEEFGDLKVLHEDLVNMKWDERGAAPIEFVAVGGYSQKARWFIIGTEPNT